MNSKILTLACCALQSALSLKGAVLTVTSPGDSGPGTLRAVLAASSPGDTINFNIGVGDERFFQSRCDRSCSYRRGSGVSSAGSACYTPRPICSDATKKPKGLEWEYQIMAADSGIVSGRFPCTFGTERLHCTLSGIMEEHKENTSQPRIPSDIRTYFFLLALAAITFVILWLVFRFI